MSRIIDQWLELKLHFQLARSNKKCFPAEVVYDIYCNEQNLAFFLFLRPALADLQRVNKLFESNNVDQTKLAIDLSTLVSLGELIVLRSFNFDPVTNDNFTNHLHPKPFFGYSFENKVIELKNNDSLNANGKKVLRDRCIQFNTILIQQLQQRLPENFNVFEKINMLLSTNVLKQVKDTISPLCELLGYESKLIEKIDFQWCIINVLLWNETTNVVQF